MRKFALVWPQFWTGNTARELRKCGPETYLLAAYLISSPHANMIGVYYLPLDYIAHETGLSMDSVRAGMERLEKLGFCKYDEDLEMVWIVAMAKYQLAEMRPGDKRLIQVMRLVEGIPERLMSAFRTYYFDMMPFLCPSCDYDGHRIDKDKDKEKEKDKKVYSSELRKPRTSEPTSASATDTAYAIEIPLCGTQGTYRITQAQIDEWQGMFPGIDVAQRLQAIRAWALANPKRRKTRRGILRHIVSWLDRDQCSARTARGNQPMSAASVSPAASARYAEALQKMQRLEEDRRMHPDEYVGRDVLASLRAAMLNQRQEDEP